MSEQPSPDVPADDGAAADIRADAEAPNAAGALATEGSSGGPAWRAQLRRPDLEPCQFPGGCANTMEYAGSGRRPKYCYQVVGGVMHDRVNAKRILYGGAPLVKTRADGKLVCRVSARMFPDRAALRKHVAKSKLYRAAYEKACREGRISLA